MTRKSYGKIKGPRTPQQIKRRQKISTVVIGVCAILAMGSVIVVPRLMAGSSDSKPQVTVAEAAKGEITSTLDISGTVESLNTRTYFSPVNANLKDYNLKVGQLVRNGDVLVSFETDTLEADNQKAQFTANATIKNNEDVVQKSQDTLNEAAVASQNVNIIQGDINNYQAYIDELNTLIANRTQELTNGAADDAAAAAQETTEQIAALNKALPYATQVETLKTANEELQNNIDEWSIEKSKMEFDQNQNTARLYEQYITKAQETVKDNETAIKKAQKQMGDYAQMSSQDIQAQITSLSSAGASETVTDPSTDAQISQWQRDLQDAQSTLSELQSDLASEKSRVEAGDSAQITDPAQEAMKSNNNLAELESSTVEELLEKGRKGIQADFNGIITKADLTPGAAVTQGLELVTLASNEEVAVNATVSKYDYDKLQEGQKATLTIGNNEYQGTVTSISRVAQDNEKGTPVISCEITIDNPDENIFLGVDARGKVTVASETGVLLIPSMAVNTEKDDTFCYVLDNGIITRKSVKTGVSSMDEVVVESGLTEGEMVIPTLPEGLTEGMEAEGITEDAAMAGTVQAEE